MARQHSLRPVAFDALREACQNALEDQRQFDGHGHYPEMLDSGVRFYAKIASADYLSIRVFGLAERTAVGPNGSFVTWPSSL